VDGVGAVDQIDLAVLYGAYRANGQGRAAYDPAMMGRTPHLAQWTSNDAALLCRPRLTSCGVTSAGRTAANSPSVRSALGICDEIGAGFRRPDRFG
jgi:hypothetical protein